MGEIAAGQDPAAAVTSWWGVQQLQQGETGRCRIGPLTLWIQRLPHEWRLLEQRIDDSAAYDYGFTRSADGMPTVDGMRRYGMSDASGALELHPRLADRPMVTRPEHPFVVPADDEIVVHVSTPLWVRVAAGEPRKVLAELPIKRPSDTWFGPPTGEGELCYASRTFLRLNQQSVPRRPHRALTAVKIINRSEAALDIEALKLPVSHLALYRCDDGLWTEDVTFERQRAGDFAALRVKQRAPSGAAGAVQIAEPRVRGEGNLVVRAFSAIFS